MLKRALTTTIQEMRATIWRFPIPAIICTLFCITAILDAHYVKDLVSNNAVLMTLFCSFYWFIALQLFAESRQWPSARIYLIGVPFLLPIAWLLFRASEPWIPFAFLGSGLFFSIFIAPFLKKDATSLQLWQFNRQVWIHISFTFLTALVLYLGVAAILASLNFLFDTEFSNHVFEDIWLIIATLFSPIFAMAGIPRDTTAEAVDFPKPIRILLSYIVLPLLFICTAILYAYIAKILLTWNLPKGGVALLVSGFGSAGIITYLVSYPLHQTPGIISLFSRYFFKLLLAPLALLAIGIGVRVVEHGITEARYAILLCLVWLSLSVFFALTKRKDLATKWIPTSIVALLLAASFGPWGAVSLSAWSQINRLENLLEKNHLLANSQVQKTTERLPLPDRIAISSIVEYLTSTKKEERIAPWFAHMPDAAIHAETNYKQASRILKDMGIDYADRRQRQSGMDYQDFRYGSYDSPSTVMDVSGYDYIVYVNGYNHYRGNTKPDTTSLLSEPDTTSLLNKKVTLTKDGGTFPLSVTFIPASNHYVVQLVGAGEPIVFDLDTLQQQVASDADISLNSRQPLILNATTERLSVRLQINRIDGRIDFKQNQPDNMEISNINSKLLIGIR